MTGNVHEAWNQPPPPAPSHSWWRDLRFCLVMFPVCLSPLFVALAPRWLIGNREHISISIAAVFSFGLFWVMYRLHNALRKAEALEGELRRQAITDVLTGVGNRRAFQEGCRQEARRAQRQGYPVSMLFVDLDRFKDINDRFGHHVGDRVLQCLGRCLVACTREDMDAVYRVGGDEFVVLIPSADAEGAAIVRERILARYPEEAGGIVDFEHGLSIGSATLRKGETAVEWFTRADQNMYERKGRWERAVNE